MPFDEKNPTKRTDENSVKDLPAKDANSSETEQVKGGAAAKKKGRLE